MKDLKKRKIKLKEKFAKHDKKNTSLVDAADFIDVIKTNFTEAPDESTLQTLAQCFAKSACKLWIFILTF